MILLFLLNFRSASQMKRGLVVIYTARRQTTNLGQDADIASSNSPLAYLYTEPCNIASSIVTSILTLHNPAELLANWEILLTLA